MQATGEPPASIGAASFEAMVCGSLWRNRIFVGILLTAAILYSFHIGREPLGASEAYSALAAMQPTLPLVAHKALSLDPGKPVLYHLLLHWFCGWFGSSETSLRAMSLLFALSSVVLIYALSLELFGAEVALAAALVWAFNPLAVLFAQWARMYSMFIAITLAHLLAMARLRRRPTPAGAAIGGLLGALMLYTHLGGLLVIGAEIAMVVRDFWLRGKSNAWPALAIAIALFGPFVPIAVVQGRSLVNDHWLDWIGQRRARSLNLKLMVGAISAAAGGWLVFAKGSGRERTEGLRWCAALAFFPVLALIAGSVLVRPMFQVRYLAPCWALLAVALVGVLDAAGQRSRRLGTAFVFGIFVTFIPWYHGSRYAPWRDVAHQIEKAGSNATEPVVFEAGFFAETGSLGGVSNDGFPAGYYRVPFDYYFHAANPREVVPASDPIRARAVIADQLDKAGGVWLVSGKTWPEAMREVPATPRVSLLSASKFEDVILLHLKRAGA